jgi:hypothetical protein
MQKTSNYQHTLVSFAAGVGLGAGVIALITPNSGPRNRRTLLRNAKAVKRNLFETARIAANSASSRGERLFRVVGRRMEGIPVTVAWGRKH